MKECGAIKVVNTGQLHAELDAALPGLVIGVSTYGRFVPISIWLDDEATDDDLKTALAVLTDHVPQPETPSVDPIQAQIDDLKVQVAALKQA